MTTDLASIFSLALNCAASIMATDAPQWQYHVNVGVIGSEMCAAGGRESCGAVYIAARPTPRVLFGENDAYDWSLWVHEACHAVQDWQGRTVQGADAEAECLAVGARAFSCPAWGGQ